MTTTTTPSAPPVAPAAADVGPPSRWRRQLLATTVLAQPVLIGINALFHPDVDITGAGVLAGAEEGPTRWYVVHLVAALGAVLGVPAAVALRRLVGRHRVLADTATVAAVVASVVLAMTFVAEASVMRLLAAGDITDAAALSLAEDYTGTPEFFAVPLGILGSVVSGVLFGIALFRERRVPRFAPVLLIVGSAATVVAAPGTPVGPIAFGIIALSASVLAHYVATADWADPAQRTS